MGRAFEFIWNFLSINLFSSFYKLFFNVMCV